MATDTATLRLDQLIDPGFSSVISRTFHHIDLAEEAIKQAQARHPKQANKLWATFRQLQPTEALKTKGDELILAHCAELLDHVAAGWTDLSLPTKAEMLGFLVDLTLMTPPGPAIEYWHATLFLDLYAEGRLAVTDPELIEQVEGSIKASTYRASKDDLDAFYSKLQHQLTTERPISERGA